MLKKKGGLSYFHLFISYMKCMYWGLVNNKFHRNCATPTDENSRNVSKNRMNKILNSSLLWLSCSNNPLSDVIPGLKPVQLRRFYFSRRNQEVWLISSGQIIFFCQIILFRQQKFPVNKFFRPKKTFREKNFWVKFFLIQKCFPSVNCVRPFYIKKMLCVWLYLSWINQFA